MKKLENDVAVMQDRLEAVQDEADRLEKVLASLSEELENNPRSRSAKLRIAEKI
jgi:16S rRNA C1402 N4-methylase RsmH